MGLIKFVIIAPSGSFSYGLAPRSGYKWRVRAANGGVTGTDSDVSTLTIQKGGKGAPYDLLSIASTSTVLTVYGTVEFSGNPTTSLYGEGVEVMNENGLTVSGENNSAVSCELTVEEVIS